MLFLPDRRDCLMMRVVWQLSTAMESKKGPLKVTLSCQNMWFYKRKTPSLPLIKCKISFDNLLSHYLQMVGSVGFSV